jgi:predicted MFS family arabinose efflux permease
MFRQPGFIIFMFIIIIWGIGESSIGNFLFLHIKSLGGSSTLMGTALSLSLIGEIVIFSFAHKIQAHLKPQMMVLVAFVVLFAWLTGLSLIRDPNAIPLFQIFGGAGFALLQSGSVAYVDQRAPREIGTTAQAIRGGLYSGLGVGTGSIISGLIYEAYGSVFLFRTMSFVAVAGFIFGLVAYQIDRRKNRLTANSS